MKYANDNNVPPVVITAVPVHGAHVQKPPTTEYRLTINEHDSWSGPDRFYHFYPTLEKAIAGKAELIEEIRQDRLENAGKPTPEYYITVGDIHEVIRKDDAIFIGKVVG